MLHILKNCISKDQNSWRYTIGIILPAFILILFYFSEFASKILKYNYFEFTRVSAIVKLITEIALCFYIVRFKKSSRNRLFKIVGLFVVFYFLGHIFLNQKGWLETYFRNLHSLNGYLYIFILYFALKPKDLSGWLLLEKQLAYLDAVLKGIFIINGFAIFAGLLFEWDVFATYLGRSNRFGYNGLFLHASHSSYIYILFTLYFYWCILSEKSKNNLSFFFGAIVLSTLVGTKTIYLFQGLFLCFLVLRYLKKQYIFMCFGIGAITILALRPIAMSLFKSYFGVLYDVYEDHGVLTMLFSYRNLSVTQDFLPYIVLHWTPLNYLLGGADFYTARTEIEPIDLFWFFGLLGALVYLYLFYSTFVRIMIKSKDLILPLVFFFICVTLSGSFFTNAPVIPFFLILFFVTSNTTYSFNLP